LESPLKSDVISEEPVSLQDDEKTTAVVEPARFLAECEGVRDVIAESAVCRVCKKGSLSVTFKSIGIVSKLHTRCSHCKAHSASSVQRTGIISAAERQDAYAANILYVLSMMASGDGGTEAGRCASFLHLPTSASIRRLGKKVM